MLSRSCGRILDAEVRTVMLTLGFVGEERKEENQLGRPLRYSPNSPAVSMPVGPPPAMMMLRAVVKAVRKAFQLQRSVSSSWFRPKRGEDVDAPVAMTRAW